MLLDQPQRRRVRRNAGRIDELPYLQYPGIEDIHGAVTPHEGVLILHSYAYIAWLTYLAMEKEHLCP